MTRARASLLIFSLALTLAVTALAGVSVVRKVETFQPLGFSARPAGAGWQVERVDDAGSALRPGDLVFQVDGREAEDLPVQLRGKPSSELLVARGEEVLSLPYLRPPLDVDFPFLLICLIGTGYLLIGVYTLSRQSGRPGVLFFLWCLASAVLYLFEATFIDLGDTTPDTLDKVLFAGDELARVWLPALTLHLFLVFPRRLDAAWLRRVVPFVYLPAAVFTTLELDFILNDGGWFFGSSMHSAVWVLDRLELVHLVAFGLASVAVLAWRLARHVEWEQRRQVQWIAFGLAAGYLPFAVLYLLPWLFGLKSPEALTAAAVLPLALVPLAFAWSILRHKLWDIQVLVRDTLSSTLALMLGIVGFSLLQMAIQRGLPQDLTTARTLLSVVAGVAVAGLLVPARQTIAAGVERFQYRGTFGKRRSLADLADDLLRERDLTRLARRLTDHLEENVPLERVNLYLAAGPELKPVWPEPGLPEALPLEGLGSVIWEQEVRPLSATALPAERIPQQQRFFLAGYRYAFPLRVLGNRVGLVLTGYRPEQIPLNSDDIELVRQLLDQAALAIENAQLLSQLRQRLNEVVRLKEYTEGIIESTPAGIAVIDGDGQVVSANAALATLAALDENDPESPAALAGRPFEDLLPMRPLPAPDEGTLEMSYCELSGRERYFEVSVSSFARDPGVPLSIVMVHDVSERVAMENALRERERLAALGMLAAGVAHEVNTPITGISSYAQMLLAETEPDDPRYEILRKVERQTFRAARIVNNLLEFARNKGSEQHALDVLPVIDETLDLLHERFVRRSIEIVWQRPAGPVVARSNEGELQQVLSNLFVNACDAMPGGGILGVEVEETEAAVRIAVMDTGVGIPPERLKTIFQPFFSTKISGGGSGLGLAISHEIVRRHGGDLTVESRLGEGSHFVVELPRAGEADPVETMR